jgi:hypothetical protein
MKRFATNADSGNIAFYLVAVFPLVITFSVLAVDLSAWSALQDEIQREADRLAFQATQLLPNREHALGFVLSEAERSKKYQIEDSSLFNEDFATSNAVVTIALRSDYKASFDIFLRPLGLEQLFQVVRSSSAQLVPTDYVIILPDGHSLRPHYGVSPWGSAAKWPAAVYWTCSGHPPANPHDDVSQNIWNRNELERWATQACFNPVLSQLKIAAINLVDAIGAPDTNRVGLIFTPGDASNRGYVIARHVHANLQNDGNSHINNQIGGFVSSGSGAQAKWIDYEEIGSRLGNELCILFSQNTPYSLSNTLSFYGLQMESTSSCNQVLSTGICSHTSPFGLVNHCYLTNSLQLREAIYWNMAKLPISFENLIFDAEPNIILAIEAALAELTYARGHAQEKEIRGNIATQSQRKIIILTDNVPSITDTRSQELIASLAQANIKLVLVGFHHPYINSNILSGRLSEFEAIAHSILDSYNNSSSNLEIFEASSPTELREKIIPYLIIKGRQLSLRT